MKKKKYYSPELEIYNFMFAAVLSTVTDSEPLIQDDTRDGDDIP